MSKYKKPATIFCDIDGTILYHHCEGLDGQVLRETKMLEGTIEKLREWDAAGHNIILVTGRRESLRGATVFELNKLGLYFDKLIMGIGGGDRILINDRKPTGRNTAYSYNLNRNSGIKNIDIEESVRPWGSYEVLLDSEDCKVKRLYIKKGHRPSYQYHHKRTEYWTIVKGRALVTLDGEELIKEAGASITVPAGVQHRIKNIGEDTLVFIEVQVGDYFGEDDIVRVSDDYNRTK